MADAAIAGGRLGSVAEWRTRLFGALADRLAEFCETVQAKAA